MFLKIAIFSLLVTAAICSEGADAGDDTKKKTTTTTTPAPTTSTETTTTTPPTTPSPPTPPTTPPTPPPTTTTPAPPPTTTTPSPSPPPTPSPSPSPAPTPAPTPTPSDAHWVVRNQTDGSVCLMLKAGLQLDIPYKMTNDKMGNAKVVLEKTANVTGMCNSAVEMMKLSGENLTMSIYFNVNRTSKQYWLSNITSSVPINPALFPNATATNTTGPLILVFAGKEFITPLNNSFTCNSELQLNINITNSNNTARLSLKELKLEAFHHTSEPKFSSAFECEKDHETPDIVPIAVGVAIAVLIVAVLVAYLVSRRRTQARGYLSM